MGTEYKGAVLQVRDNKDEYPEYYVGWVGFNCSYCGKWFGWIWVETKTRIGTIRDYQAKEAIRFIKSQSENMEGIEFCGYPITVICKYPI